MDETLANYPPHATKLAWIGSTKPFDDLRDAVERHVSRSMPHRVLIPYHDHAHADDILEWLSLHASGPGVVALLDGDDAPLTGFFAELGDAVLFKLRFG